MSSSNNKRLLKDLIDILTTKYLDENFAEVFLPKNGNITKWILRINIDDLRVYFQLDFPSSYPLQAPGLSACTFIPNMSKSIVNNTVCLDILGQRNSLEVNKYLGWSESYSALSILMQLQDFFNTDGLLDSGAVTDFVENHSKALKAFESAVLPSYEKVERKCRSREILFLPLKSDSLLSESKNPSTEHLCNSDGWNSIVKKNNRCMNQSSNTSNNVVRTHGHQSDQNIFQILSNSTAVVGDENIEPTSTSVLKQTNTMTIMPLMTARLDKTLAVAGVCSRTEAKKLIKSGRIFVNGKLVTGDFISDRDVIMIDGKQINYLHLLPKFHFTGASQKTMTYSDHLWESELIPSLPSHVYVDETVDKNHTINSGIPPSTGRLYGKSTHTLPVTMAMTTNASHFRLLSNSLIQDILFQLPPNDIASMTATGRFIHTVCTEGNIWQSLVSRHFPYSELIPDHTTNGMGWKAIWLLLCNGIYYDEIRCFFTKAGVEEDVLGIPIDFTVNPKTNKVDYIHSTMDILGYEAFAKYGHRKTEWGDKVLAWLPLFFSEEHFGRALPLLLESLKLIATGAKVVSPIGRAFTVAASTNGDNGPTIIPTGVVLEVLPRILNTIVVLLVDKGMSDLDQALRGYCLLHRLFIALVAKSPTLQRVIADKLQGFAANEQFRSKEKCPNLGELVVLLSVCGSVGWMDIIVPLMKESFARAVLWLCRDVPELATISKRTPAVLLKGSSAAEHLSPDVLQRMFDAHATVRKLLSFHCSFLRLNAGSRGVDLKSAARRYDRTFGLPPRHMRNRLIRLLESATNTTSWGQYFSSVCMTPPSLQQLQRMWVESIVRSHNQRYHSASTDFSRIQNHGVSSILLRGQSYQRQVIAIDVSGSMDSEFMDQVSGVQMTRLDFVKRDLRTIFDTKLSHRQQFSIIQFNHTAQVWSKGLQQATKAALDSAANFVNDWVPDGGTNFELALKAAFAVPDVQAVYLLSDGEVGEDVDQLVSLARRLSRNGKVHCHTTAFFAPLSGQRLLEAIAVATNGSYLNYCNKEE